MQFAYEAMRPDGNTVTDQIEAGDRTGAASALREKGLIVLRLDERTAAPRSSGTAGRPGHASKVTTRDLILLTRQMKMLLESGAPLVPALQATEEQNAEDDAEGDEYGSQGRQGKTLKGVENRRAVGGDTGDQHHGEKRVEKPNREV